MPSRRIIFIGHRIRSGGSEEPNGSVVVEGESNHLAEFLDLRATVAVDADEFFSCHFVYPLS